MSDGRDVSLLYCRNQKATVGKLLEFVPRTVVVPSTAVIRATPAHADTKHNEQTRRASSHKSQNTAVAQKHDIVIDNVTVQLTIQLYRICVAKV